MPASSSSLAAAKPVRQFVRRLPFHFLHVSARSLCLAVSLSVSLILCPSVRPCPSRCQHKHPNYQVFAQVSALISRWRLATDFVSDDAKASTEHREGQGQGGIPRWVSRTAFALLYMFWCRLALPPPSPLRCRLITFAPMDKRHLMTQSCQQWVEAKSAKENFCSTQCFTHFSNGAEGQLIPPPAPSLPLPLCKLAKCKWVVRAPWPRVHF